MGSLSIKNWAKFQHFKNRKPPWIRLYRDILDDPDWHDLSPKNSKVLIMLWLIASEDKEMKGQLPDVRTLAFRLRMTERDLIQALKDLSGWLYHVDINLISTCHQLEPESCPETETETETEERQSNTGATSAPVTPKKQFSPPSVEDVSEYASSKGYQLDAAGFVDFYTSKGWMVGKNKMKDWKAAVRNWIRNDKNDKTKGSKPTGRYTGMTHEEGSYL